MPTSLDEARTGNTVADLTQAILDSLYYVQGRIPALATPTDWYMALAYTVRDRLMNDWITAFSTMRKEDIKIVGYLSAEFLIGPQLGNNLLNLGIREPVKQALSELGLDLDVLAREEPEPGLGNGGLGRLAACPDRRCRAPARVLLAPEHPGQAPTRRAPASQVHGCRGSAGCSPTADQ